MYHFNFFSLMRIPVILTEKFGKRLWNKQGATKKEDGLYGFLNKDCKEARCMSLTLELFGNFNKVFNPIFLTCFI